MPAAVPVTMPAGLTDAVVGAALVHVPPVVASVSVVVPPAHILALPAIAAGDEVTLTALDTVQPEPKE